MFTVNVEDVLRAAAKGRDNGTVAAFNDNFQKAGAHSYACSYRYPGYPGVSCAIGAGFTSAQAKSLGHQLNSETVNGLVEAGAMKVTGGRRRVLQSLQCKHDAILNARSWGDQRKIDKAVVAFNTYLDAQLALLPAAA